MMNCEEVIDTYESVAQITKNMLDAARQGAWDDLIGLESKVAAHINHLSAYEAPVKLTPDLRSRKLTVIRQILADDKEIRNLTEPWMEKLSSLISSSQMEQKLSISYGNQSLR
ncbi:MAG: flagellar protein FliT [Sulfuriferula sp.]